MAKKKYYAVKIGRVPGVFESWDECKAQTDGFPAAIFKSFPSKAEAEDYLRGSSNEEVQGGEDDEGPNARIEERIYTLRDEEVVAFVDGSYDAESEKSAFGAILFTSGGGKDILYKAYTKQLGEDFISLRNVAAELEGVKEAVSWAIKYGKRSIAIYYDYEGIEKWATGEWSARKQLTRDYIRFIEEKRKLLEIRFIKVPAHSGITFNEEVDRIARSALAAKGYKTYNDGSVYFTGYGSEDWASIVRKINLENAGIEEETIEEAVITKETIGSREKIRVTQGGSCVVINCYRNSNSYVQGKQSVLFEKIIASAIEKLSSRQSLVETLNNYHALTISASEVEKRFKEKLPHYRHTSDTLHQNLFSAVYNTLLTGYMPDYTCLLMPIFRSYEYYLHSILGRVMGLKTEKSNGTNNFSYFRKDKSRGIYCLASKRGELLSQEQREYLELLYNTYSSVRHRYSHWSATDGNTAMISDMESARRVLSDGLKLADRYYTLFEKP